MKLLITFFLGIVFHLSLFSQTTDTYMLKTTRFLPVNKLEKALNLSKSNQLRVIFDELNLYSLELSSMDKLDRLKNNDLVQFVEKDERLVLRNTPNDPGFDEQYALKQIKADEIWDFTTGGTTYKGDTIVIAVLDGGCDIFHEDLFENIWINKMEIPDDSIDNDGNGYIDDYYGVNILTKNGVHRPLTHGTRVAGIIGAVGNNSTGLAGINWDVKLLPVTDILSKTRLIEGYNYAYKLRKKYNETDGKEGAFIVCANFSGGAPKPEFPEDSEVNLMWCEVYDKLGEVGIISVASTDNAARNIDIEGDMPSLCQSDYLLTVTSTDMHDNFYSERAYSKKNVDIAAPGQDILSLKPNGEPDSGFDGNSAAAPMVAGAIGLIYTVPCENFVENIEENPVGLDLKIKEYIMEYSDKHKDLTQKTVCGGRLNIVEPYVNLLDEMCSELEYREFGISQIYPNPAHQKVKIKYETNNYHKHKFIIYNNLGQVIYKELFRPSPYDIDEKIIDVSGFAKGIYYFSLISNKKTVTKQIVVY